MRNHATSARDAAACCSGRSYPKKGWRAMHEELVIAVRFSGHGTRSHFDEGLRQELWEAAQDIIKRTGYAGHAELILDNYDTVGDEPCDLEEPRK